MKKRIWKPHKDLWFYLSGNLGSGGMDDLFLFFLRNPEWFHKAEYLQDLFGEDLTILSKN